MMNFRQTIVSTSSRSDHMKMRGVIGPESLRPSQWSFKTGFTEFFKKRLTQQVSIKLIEPSDGGSIAPAISQYLL
jgi:hypothetical protein